MAGKIYEFNNPRINMEEKSNKKTRKQPQNILCQFLLIQPNAKKKKKKMPRQNLKLGTSLSEVIF